MKLIEVVQHRKYYYVHLFFIYSRKKLDEIFGGNRESEASAPKKPIEKKEPQKENKARLKPSVPSVRPVLKLWLDYCNKNGISYGKSNRTYWENQLKNRLTIDQQKAIYTAINKGWKNFYMVSTKESKYQKFLGKSLMMDRDCDTLLDITSIKDNRFIYQFKNIKVTSTGSPQELFSRYGYTKTDVKTAPMVSQVKDKIMGVIKRF